MSEIQKLSRELANQIAAGEVIERPASVIKELLENALDAGATKLNVEVSDAGSGCITITDNGKGILKEELPLAIAAHATSKIHHVDDLFAIKTLGFRGEALASIASVSKFTLTSLHQNAKSAYSLYAEGGDIKDIKPAAHEKGTTIIVDDLFFNTPVRRRFLRQAKTEKAHIEAMVKRLMLCRFDLSLRYKVNDREVFNLPAAKTDAEKAKRVAKIFGQPFMKEAIEIDASSGNLKLNGFLGSPNYLRSQNDLQFCYINGRMVKDKLILHAIREVLEPLLYPGRQATFLLFLTLPETELDVNVHPTKHEVRFYEPRHIHDFITSSLKRALAKTSPTLNQEQAPALAPIPVMPTGKENTLKDYFSPLEQKSMQKTQSIISAPASFLSTASQNEGKVVALMAPFALYLSDNDTLLFDANKLYRQLLLKNLQTAFSQNQVLTRPLLLPYSFNSEKIPLGINELQSLGLVIEALGESTYVLRAFPVLTPYLDFKALIEDLEKIKDANALLKAYLDYSKVSWQSLSGEDRQMLIQQCQTNETAKNGKALKKIDSNTLRAWLDA